MAPHAPVELAAVGRVGVETIRTGSASERGGNFCPNTTDTREIVKRFLLFRKLLYYFLSQGKHWRLDFFLASWYKNKMSSRRIKMPP